jgi:nicotinate-nucleotide--dimethylbenzimidazole phosphoribosyltransferase
MDHTSDVLLVAMRRRLGYGYDEIAKGVPCPAPGPADAAPACTPAPTPADAPAAPAGQPAAAERCSSPRSAPDCTEQELTAVPGDLPVVQQSTPCTAAVVSLQQPGPQQASAAMPTAAEAAALQPADAAQSPSQVPAPDQPLCSAAQGTPPVDVQHSSMLEMQLPSPAAISSPSSLQQKLAAACELLPQQVTTAGQQQRPKPTKATPAAVSRQSAVVVPATAVQGPAAKPAVATPTTDLPMLSSELLTEPPAANVAAVAESPEAEQAAAASTAAEAPRPPGASHQQCLCPECIKTHDMRNENNSCSNTKSKRRLACLQARRQGRSQLSRHRHGQQPPMAASGSLAGRR